MQSLEDAELVALARGGSREAFACLLTRHLRMAQRVCSRVLASATDDVLQEAALQAWLGLPQLRDANQFGAWLTGIALNVARVELRRTRRGPLSYDELWGGRLHLEPVDDAPAPAEVLEVRDFSDAVRAAVDGLPRGQRQAVLLVYLAGLTYRETAAALGIEVGAVKTRLHKARGTLRESLRALWLEEMMLTETQMIEMHVVDVRRRTTDEGHRRSVVVLEEVGGNARQLPIWVGQWESDSIAMLLEKLHVPRPMTHALTANLLRAAGVGVESVQIHRLVEETFYAQVLLAGRGAVDSRPSDAIALALEMGTPIYVAADVLEAVLAARGEQRLGELPGPSIGAAEIVEHLIEHWPSGSAKPSR